MLDVLESIFMGQRQSDNAIVIPAKYPLTIKSAPSGDIQCHVSHAVLQKEVDQCLAQYEDIIDGIEKALDIINAFDVPCEAATKPSIEHTSSEKHTVLKSSFIAHHTYISTAQEALAFQTLLKETFPNASHHILAYHASDNYDYDDDGESGAGMKLVYMLRQKSIKNCAVVVSRWFGGTKLGPQRFRIITTVALDHLKDIGLVQ